MEKRASFQHVLLGQKQKQKNKMQTQILHYSQMLTPQGP